MNYSNWSNFQCTLHIFQDRSPLNNSPMNMPIWNSNGKGPLYLTHQSLNRIPWASERTYVYAIAINLLVIWSSQSKMQRATPMISASARMASRSLLARFFFTRGHRPNHHRSHGQEPVGAAYKALGLKNNASLQEVKAAYRRLALKWCVHLPRFHLSSSLCPNLSCMLYRQWMQVTNVQKLGQCCFTCLFFFRFNIISFNVAQQFFQCELDHHLNLGIDSTHTVTLLVFPLPSY